MMFDRTKRLSTAYLILILLSGLAQPQDAIPVELTAEIGQVGSLFHAALSADGKLAMLADSDTVGVWDLSASRELQHIPASEVTAIAFGPRSGIVSIGGEDGTRILQLSVGTEFQLAGTGRSTCLAFAPEGDVLLACDAGNVAQLWDIASRKVVYRLVGHSAPVTAGSISGDGTRVITGAQDGSILIWSRTTGRRTIRLERPGHLPSPGVPQDITAVALTTDGSLA